MLEEGYIYDPASGSYYIPSFEEPVTAASDSDSTTQYQGDPDMLAEGFTYDPYLDIYYIDEDFPMMDDISVPYLASNPNFPNFNPNMVPWETAPQYIKEILYNTPFIATTSTSYPSGVPWKIPFVLVLTNGEVVRVIVGINLMLGTYFSSADNNSSTIFAPTGVYVLTEVLNVNADILPGVEYACAYEARYAIDTMDLLVDWHALEPLALGNRFTRFTGSLLNFSLGWDFYCYGGNNCKPGVISYNTAVNTGTTASSYPRITTVTDAALGFAGNRFLYKQDEYDFAYFSSFVPATYEEKQLETEKGILSGIKGMWESIKSLPETIGEKIKSLFIPREGYFDTYTSDFQNYFKDRFGLLYELPEVVISILRQLVEFSPDEDNYSIHFPQVTMPVLENGEWSDKVLIEERDITFDFLQQGAFKTLYNLYVSAMWLMYILALINLIIRKADKVFGGSG